jgi:hypothetical protein
MYCVAFSRSYRLATLDWPTYESNVNVGCVPVPCLVVMITTPLAPRDP